ncbi:MAG: PrsW family glutamic-type intramembrane protease [Patescibacteria group bacterium]
MILGLSYETIAFSLAGGVFPTFLWLWFWLREDSAHPEPKRFVIATFLAGMASVIIVLPIQRLIYDYFGNMSSYSLSNVVPILKISIVSSTILIIIWAAFEEIFKYLAAHVAGMWRGAMDEPIDAVMYLITAALGFAAMENTLFLVEPIIAGNFTDSIITGNLRFVGSTLLHVLSSAVVGVFMAFAFYKSRVEKFIYAIFGLILATALHTLFNLSIIDASEGDALITFSFLWILILGLLLFLEKVKSLKQKTNA